MARPPEPLPEPFLQPAYPVDPAVLNRIVQESADCIKVLDLDARLLSMNTGGQQTMEIDDFSVCHNLLWPDFWSGEDRLQVEAALDRARLGEPSSFEGRATTFKGTPRWWEVRVAPLLNKAGAVHQLLAISRDITARKEAELALSALNTDLEHQVQVRIQQALQHVRAQEAFMAFTEAVGSETDLLALARQAITVLRARFHDGSIGYYTPDGDLWKARVWSEDMGEVLVAQLRAGLPSSTHFIRRALETGTAVFTDAWDPEREQIGHSEEYGSASAYPLIVDGEVRHLLLCGLKGTRRWSEPDRALVRAVARGLNLALERAEDLRQLTERGVELETLNRDLQRERTFLQAVLQSMSEGLVACDEHGALTLFNEATRTFHGQDASPLPPEEWAGHYDLFGGDGVTPLSTDQVPLYRAWQGETLRDAELVIRPGWGAARQLLASGGPLVTLDGRPLGAVVTMRDVTLSRAANQQLQRSHQQLLSSNAELRAANEELEAFAYSASHDLKTPVRHVKSFSELARKALGEASPEVAARHLGFVEQAATRMNTLIDAMLLLSRSTRQEMTLKSIALEDLVKRARTDLDADLEGRQVEWRLGPLPQVRGDPALLQQVMTNLLSNAVKFSRTREQALIEVWGEETPSSWMVFVRDNGVGFEEKYKERLFGVFQRLHTDREFEGTGVGLATVRRIVLRHGGTVDASSTPGQGATFSFTLPRDDQGSSAKSGPPEPSDIASVEVQTLIRNG